MKTRSRRLKTLSALETVAWMPRQQIPGAETAKEYIEAAIDSKQKHWAIWKHVNGSVFEIWYSKRRLKREWHPAQQLVPVNGIQEIGFAIAPDDAKLVVWQELHPGAPKRVAYFEFAATPTGQPFYFPNTDGKFDAFPQVAASGDGTRHVVYAHGDQIVYAQSRKGKKWNSEMVTGVGFTRPYIAIDDSTGIVHLGYLKLEGKQLFYTNRPLSGGAWATPKLLGVGEDLNIVARNGKVLLSWGNDFELGRRLSIRTFENNRLSKKVSPPGIEVSSYAPHGAIDSKGNPHLIWSQSTTGGDVYDIYFSDFVDGQWTSAAPLEVTMGNDRGNDLAIDGLDGLHAVYLTKNPFEIAYSTDRPSPQDTQDAGADEV